MPIKVALGDSDGFIEIIPHFPEAVLVRVTIHGSASVKGK
jgi:hypothetical protein